MSQEDAGQNLKIICEVSKKTEIMGNSTFNVIESFHFFSKRQI